MNLYIVGHKFNYEMENLCRLFFPHEKIKVEEKEASFEPMDDFYVLTVLENSEIYTKIYAFERSFEKRTTLLTDDNKENEREMAVALFNCFVRLTSFTPRWGILTGVRPIKLFRRLQNDGESTSKACEYFKNKLWYLKQKLNLHG